jgi:hypothetical protein
MMKLLLCHIASVFDIFCSIFDISSRHMASHTPGLTAGPIHLRPFGPRGIELCSHIYSMSVANFAIQANFRLISIAQSLRFYAEVERKVPWKLVKWTARKQTPTE